MSDRQPLTNFREIHHSFVDHHLDPNLTFFISALDAIITRDTGLEAEAELEGSSLVVRLTNPANGASVIFVRNQWSDRNSWAVSGVFLPVESR